jgi:hypothetical protein
MKAFLFTWRKSSVNSLARDMGFFFGYIQR